MFANQKPFFGKKPDAVKPPQSSKPAQQPEEKTKIKEIDEETRFIDCYQLNRFNQDLDNYSFQDVLKNVFKKIGEIIKPIDGKLDVIHNDEIFSQPTFLGVSEEKIQRLNFDATMAIGEVLCFFLLGRQKEETIQINQSLPVPGPNKPTTQTKDKPSPESADKDAAKQHPFDVEFSEFEIVLEKALKNQKLPSRFIPYINVLILAYALRNQQLFESWLARLTSSAKTKSKPHSNEKKKRRDERIEQYKMKEGDHEQIEFMKSLFRAANTERGIPEKCLPTISETLEFLYNKILVQQLLVQSRSFKAFVEIIGKTILIPLISKTSKSSSKGKGQSQLLKYLIEFEKQRRIQQLRCIPTFKFTQTIINLYDDPNLCDIILDSSQSDLIQRKTGFGSPSFFISFVDLLTALVKTKEQAKKVFDLIKNYQSEILSFDNFFDALFNHPSDFINPELSNLVFSAEDVMAIEAVMRLLAALFNQNQKFLDVFNEMTELKQKYFKEQNDTFVNCFVHKILAFTQSSVPATLKAESLNCLASVHVNIWPLLSNSILTKQMVEEAMKPNVDANNKLIGIIIDILTVEKKSSVFNIPTAFANLFASLLSVEEIRPVDLTHFHQFLYDIILTQSKTWNYDYPDIKWRMIKAICNVYINLLNRSDWLELSTPLFTTALTNSDFIKQFSELANEQACPVEVLMAIYKLFLLLLWKENDFIAKSLQSNNPMTPAIVNHISRNEEGLIKMFRCSLSLVKNFQIIALELVEFLAIASPPIVQMLLTKQAALALPICIRLVQVDESEEIEPNEVLEKDQKNRDITLNVRCYLLRMLKQLGSTAFLTRFICGFDQHDPPRSIIQSNIDQGLLKPVLKKLLLKSTHVHFPIFVEKAYKLLLIECQQDLTIKATLNLIYSENQFFETQLAFLSSIANSSAKAIGILLQLMAIECSNRKTNSKKTFDTLMSVVPENSSQLKIFNFIDKVRDERKSTYILNGIKNISVAYLTSKSFVDYMNSQNSANWANLWLDVLFHLLEKIKILPNGELTQRAFETCSIISDKILIQKVFGPINPNEGNLMKLYKSSLQAISLVKESAHQDARISVYSLLNAILNSIQPTQQRKRDFVTFQDSIFRVTLMDTKSQIPILKSAALNAIESLIEFASPDFFNPLFDNLIKSSDNDWALYSNINTRNSAAYCISQKCKLYSKFITTAQRSETSYSLLSQNKMIITEGLIVKMANYNLWNNLGNIISKPTERETEIELVTDIFNLFSLISMAFHDSENLRIQLNWFLSEYQSKLKLFIEFDKTLSIPILYLFSAFFKFLSSFSHIEDLKKYNMWDLIPVLYKKFANDLEWKSQLQPSLKTNEQEEANVIASKILMSSVFVLLRMTKTENVLGDPVSGEEWRTEKIKGKMPLSIITSYACESMKQIRSENSKNDTSKIESQNNDIEIKKSVISACLLIIWQHLERRKDVGIDPEQIKLFKEEPFKSYKGGSPLDSLILKKLAQF